MAVLEEVVVICSPSRPSSLLLDLQALNMEAERSSRNTEKDLPVDSALLYKKT